MERDYVTSTNIVSVGYDEQNEILEVEFRDGAVYQYYNVNKQLYDQFMAAPSKGQFLAYQIKNSFPYSRV